MATATKSAVTNEPPVKSPPIAPKSGFIMPEVRIHERVLVSNRYPFSDPIPGFVTAVTESSVDITVFGSNFVGTYEDCLHVDDPRLMARPDIINQNEERGVFRLADSEQEIKESLKHIRAFADRLTSIESSMAVMGKQLAALHKSFNDFKKKQ